MRLSAANRPLSAIQSNGRFQESNVGPNVRDVERPHWPHSRDVSLLNLH